MDTHIHIYTHTHTHTHTNTHIRLGLHQKTFIPGKESVQTYRTTTNSVKFLQVMEELLYRLNQTTLIILKYCNLGRCETFIELRKWK
jgi:hypothetical protein